MENRTFDELTIGETADLKRLCTSDDLVVFANVSGNHNPIHWLGDEGNEREHRDAVMPGMFVGSLISAVLGNVLPGAGTLFHSQSFNFHNRARVGDELLSRVTVTDKDETTFRVTLATEVTRP